MIRRVYLAGPMSGIPQMNFPAFDAAAKDLRSRGYDVVSPAELDDPEDRALALASEDGDISKMGPGKSWGFFLARDVKLIADEGIEAIVCLPGWYNSRGARLETFVGRLCDIPILWYTAGTDLCGACDVDIDIAHGPDPRFDTYDDIEDPGPPPIPDAYADLIRQTNEETAKSCSRFLAMAEEHLPSEKVRRFDTGATRDTATGKFDFEGYLSPRVLWEFARYMTANREMPDGSMRDSDNWQKGIPLDVYMKSLLRHVFDLWMLHRGERETRPEDGKAIEMHDTLGGALFNLQGYWHEQIKAEGAF